MNITLMTDRYGFDKAIKETREEWLENLLLRLGIDVHVIHELERPHFVDYLNNNKIQIIEYLDIGALQVRYEDEIVGEWGEPQLTLKKEDGKFYYEVNIENWSIIDEDISL